MTDERELLELAAKAFGYTKRVVELGLWNPHEDDGDALRLACALCMTVSCGPVSAQANTIAGALRGFSAVEGVVSQEQAQAVRRAIVRAAAEIGRNME